jgi:tetratricopeptide (TPR) repeat protein
VSLDRLGKLEEAIEAYRKATEIKPDYAQAWNNLGVSLDRLGRLEEAIEVYRKATEIKPDYADAWYNLGVSLGRLGKLEEAIEVLRQALEIAPDNTVASFMLVLFLVEKEAFREALELARKSLTDTQIAEDQVILLAESFTRLTAAGFGQECLEIIQGSPSAHLLEPLVVGIKLWLREEVLAPVEILEVGKDVQTKIRYLQEEMKRPRRKSRK